ncbi:MAG: DUF3267 domain-containing protein [Pyrinomonadaceae bacterium]|nr:DUF3267 domain-containing protein [Pyrinomonadaceae bacterium]
MNQPAKPTITNLQNRQAYGIIESFSHDEVIPVTRKYLFRANAPNLLYLLVNLCAFAFAARLIFYGESLLGDKLSYLGVGFLSTFLVLVPVHEYVHFFAYRFCGAKNVRVEYRWRQMSALCIADDFIVSGKNFVFVALAPFVVVNSIILLACLYGSDNVRIFLSGALISHVAACSGDVGLVNLVWLSRRFQTWTYDDSSNQTSYFFREIAN